MSKNAKIVVAIIIALIVIFALAKWQKHDKNEYSSGNKSDTKMAAGETYKIGVLLPLTGDAASYGEPGQKVLQMAVDELNNNGSMGSNKLKLIFEDAKCNGKDATAAAQKLVNVDSVQIIIGGFCSSESLAAVPVAEKQKVAIFSIGSSSPKLTGVSSYFFRIFPSDASQGSLDAEIANEKGYKTVAFIQEQQDYTLGIYQAFTKRFEELGGKTIKEEFAPGTADFKTQLTKLRGQKPDALFIDAQASAGDGRILKQLKDLGWQPKLFINEALAGDTAVIAENKSSLEGAIGAEFTVDPSNSKFKHLIDSYKQKYGAELPYQSYGQTEYDSIYLVKDGLMAVGYNGEKFAQWSRTIKNWEGASGKLSIKPDGDRESGYSPEIVKDGKMVPYTE